MQTYHHVDMEGVSIYPDSCLLHHHDQPSSKKRSSMISFGTLNGKFMFPVMENLSGNDFIHCPEMVMRDVIRMWSQVNGDLPGASVTTPTFSDGYIDVNPSQSIRLTRPKDGHFNRCYSSFIYSPENFHNEMLRTGQWALSMDVKCIDHYFVQLGKRYCIDNHDSTEHICSHCTPLPDRLKPQYRARTFSLYTTSR